MTAAASAVASRACYGAADPLEPWIVAAIGALATRARYGADDDEASARPAREAASRAVGALALATPGARDAALSALGSAVRYAAGRDRSVALTWPSIEATLHAFAAILASSGVARWLRPAREPARPGAWECVARPVLVDVIGLPLPDGLQHLRERRALARASSVVAALLVGPAAEAAARGDGAPLQAVVAAALRALDEPEEAPATPPCATAVRDEAEANAADDAHVSMLEADGDDLDDEPDHTALEGLAPMHDERVCACACRPAHVGAIALARVARAVRRAPGTGALAVRGFARALATSALAAYARSVEVAAATPPRTCRASVEKLLDASVDLTLVAAATERDAAGELVRALHEPAAHRALALVSAGDDDAIAEAIAGLLELTRAARRFDARAALHIDEYDDYDDDDDAAADGDIASLGRTELVSAFVTAVGKVLCSVSICADEGVARAAHELENATAALGVGGEQSRHAWQSA